MNSKSILAAFALALLLSSCGPLIFSADFNADTVNNAPNPNPPGAPSDDEIKGNCGITIVNSSVFSSKAMRFFNDSNCTFDLMWFESGNVAASNNFLNYTFNGYAEDTSHRKFHMNFGGGHFRSAFSIMFDNGNMYLTDGSSTNLNIGTYSANQKQTYIVGINRTTNRYSMTIARSGTSNIQLSDRAIKEATFWGQPAYILHLYYDPDDTSTSSNGYVLDDVKINKEKLD